MLRHTALQIMKQKLKSVVFQCNCLMCLFMYDDIWSQLWVRGRSLPVISTDQVFKFSGDNPLRNPFFWKLRVKRFITAWCTAGSAQVSQTQWRQSPTQLSMCLQQVLELNNDNKILLSNNWEKEWHSICFNVWVKAFVHRVCYFKAFILIMKQHWAFHLIL